MITKFSTLSVIALAFAATPALAQTGHVGLNYSSNDELDTDVVTLEGATTFAFGEQIGAQLDGNIGSYDSAGSNEMGYRLNGHLFYNGGAWKAGGLFGYSTIDYSGIAPETTQWGLEGQYNFGQFVVGASATWGDSDGLISPSIDYDNVDLNAAFYVTNNFALGARVGFGSLDNGVSSIDTSNYAIDAEYQFSSVPISLIGSWQHWELDGVPVESEAFTIGARWNFGGATLKDRDNAGFRYTAPSLLENYFGTP